MSFASTGYALRVGEKACLFSTKPTHISRTAATACPCALRATRFGRKRRRDWYIVNDLFYPLKRGDKIRKFVCVKDLTGTIKFMNFLYASIKLFLEMVGYCSCAGFTMVASGK